MRISLRSWFAYLTPLLVVGLCFVSGFAVGADHPHYVVTNDDVPPSYSAANRVTVLDSGNAISNNQSGKLSKGCVSRALKGFVTDWSYTASLALEKTTGTGGIVYVAEFGAPSSIGQIEVTSSGGKCMLTESSKSPIADPNSPGLLSIGAFPPRPF